MIASSYDKDLPHSRVPIIFSGEALPLGAYWMEVMGAIFSQQSEPLPDSVKNWLLDLHYCGGKIKHARSVDIIEWSSFLDKILYARREFLIDQLGIWGFCDGEQLWNDWVETLKIVQRIAMTRSKCEWTRKGFNNPEKTENWRAFLQRNDPGR